MSFRNRSLPGGIVASVLTPFDDDLSIANDLFTTHCARLLSEGCSGLTPFADAGEGASISRIERLNALWTLVEAGIRPEKLMPATGMCSVAETVDLTRAVLDIGCAAAIMTPPFYYRVVTEEGLFAYFARVIDRVGDDARIVLEHAPKKVKVGLPVALVRRLRSAFPEQIVGIRDASGDRINLRALLQIDGLRVYAGSEEALLDLLDQGGAGCITASANLNASAIANMLAAREAGNARDAEYLLDMVRHVRSAMRRTGFIETPKHLLSLGMGDPRWKTVRPPLVAANEKAARALGREISKRL